MKGRGIKSRWMKGGKGKKYWEEGRKVGKGREGEEREFRKISGGNGAWYFGKEERMKNY